MHQIPQDVERRAAERNLRVLGQNNLNLWIYGRQVTHPVTGKRTLIHDTDPDEVVRKIVALRREADSARLGLVSHGELLARSQALTEGPLRLRAAWNDYCAYLATKDSGRRWLMKAKGYWENHIAPFFGESCAAIELTKARMLDWCAWFVARAPKIDRSRGRRAKGYSPKMLRNVFDVVRAALRRQIDAYRLAALPWGTWEGPRVPKQTEAREALRSVEELLRLVTAAAVRDQRDRDRGRFADLTFRVTVMVLCGDRQGEAAAACWDDLENLDGQVAAFGGRAYRNFRHQAPDGWRNENPTWERPLTPCKAREAGSSERQELHPMAAWALRQQRAQLIAQGWYRPDGPVFPNRDGGWRTHAETIPPKVLRELAKDAGLPNVDAWTTHSTRHSFGTLEAAAAYATTGDRKAVQGRMRHADLATTEETYFHPLGRGTPSPQLGPVPIPAELASLERPAFLASPVAEDDPWGLGPLTEAATERASRDAKRGNRERARQEYVGRKPVDFAAAYKRWNAAGRKTALPPEVREAADRAYRRGYNAQRKAFKGELSEAQKRLCQRAAIGAKKGTLGAWKKFLVAAGNAEERGTDEKGSARR